MTTPETPDFNGWSLDRLDAQRKHLWALLVVSVGQGDPERPQLRAEHAAVCAEIASREGAVAECDYCKEHITMLGGMWTEDDGGTACYDTSAPYVPHKPEEDSR